MREGKSALGEEVPDLGRFSGVDRPIYYLC